MSYLSIDNIVCGYKDSFHLDPISFDIKRGSFSGILGPNGSGKTTLFKGITGELIPKKGTITVDNQDLLSLSIRDRAKKVAIVTQFTDPLEISVRDYVLMGRLPYRDRYSFFESSKDYEIADKFLNLTDTYRFKDKLLSQLSGGERQLVSVAKALTQEPSILLLDEPTSHLDISHQMELLNLIQRLNRSEGLTVLMIIHDLNLASEYCDNLILIDRGTLFTTGTPKEVLTYSNIETVYKTVVISMENPISKKPAIFPVSGEILNR